MDTIEDLTKVIHKDYYYTQSVAETINILENIKVSGLQDKYRQFMSDYRGVGKEVLDDMNMFYVLDGYDELDEIIPSENIREMLGIQTGNFVKQKERFVFPIQDMFGTIIGFVGYDYDETKYKYLMTFAKFAEKSRVFFNMQNITYAYNKDVCIVQEGVFDSIRLTENDYKNNLSLLGKRMTEFHLRLLSRFRLIILIPDNDNAGKEASKIWEKRILEYNGVKSNNSNYGKSGYGLAGNPFSGTSISNSRVPKIATIYIRNCSVTKTVMDPEKMEKIVIDKEVKDIDDYLSSAENVIKFNNLYNQIIRESKNPLFTTKQYSIR